ncbi:hypothetical protein WJ54_12805 [Burkholderia ubonensis]|nr:hypothetical protein WJ54_12805 [Burkholderia ubonensis]
MQIRQIQHLASTGQLEHIDTVRAGELDRPFLTLAYVEHVVGKTFQTREVIVVIVSYQLT